MNKKKRAACCAAAGGVAAAAAARYLWYENNSLVTDSFLADCHVGRELKLVQLSDLHGKQFGPYSRELIRRVLACEPDLIVCTGDLVSADLRHLKECIGLLGSLALRAPVLFVPGNHEHRSGEINRICMELERSGVTVLRDALCHLTLRGAAVHVLGLDEGKGAAYLDYLTQPERKNRSALFSQLEVCGGLRLVLSHNPENFACMGRDSYKNYRFDLMLAGHAHGGQIRLPVLGGVIAPGQGLFPRYCAGLYGSGPRLLVSRGLGNSLIPIRVGNRPEIVSLTIR